MQTESEISAVHTDSVDNKTDKEGGRKSDFDDFPKTGDLPNDDVSDKSIRR